MWLQDFCEVVECLSKMKPTIQRVGRQRSLSQELLQPFRIQRQLSCHIEQEVKVIWQKAPHGGPIPRLGVTPGVEICTIEFLG